MPLPRITAQMTSCNCGNKKVPKKGAKRSTKKGSTYRPKGKGKK